MQSDSPGHGQSREIPDNTSERGHGWQSRLIDELRREIDNECLPADCAVRVRFLRGEHYDVTLTGHRREVPVPWDWRLQINSKAYEVDVDGQVTVPPPRFYEVRQEASGVELWEVSSTSGEPTTTAQQTTDGRGEYLLSILRDCKQ
jgi:hypothetical protein